MPEALKIGDAILARLDDAESSIVIGLIRFIGILQSERGNKWDQWVGLELVEPISNGHNGVIKGQRIFYASEGCGVHVQLRHVLKKLRSEEIIDKLRNVISIFKGKLNEYIQAVKERDDYISQLREYNDVLKRGIAQYEMQLDSHVCSTGKNHPIQQSSGSFSSKLSDNDEKCMEDKPGLTPPPGGETGRMGLPAKIKAELKEFDGKQKALTTPTPENDVDAKLIRMEQRIAKRASEKRQSFVMTPGCAKNTPGTVIYHDSRHMTGNAPVGTGEEGSVSSNGFPDIYQTVIAKNNGTQDESRRPRSTTHDSATSQPGEMVNGLMASRLAPLLSPTHRGSSACSSSTEVSPVVSLAQAASPRNSFDRNKKEELNDIEIDYPGKDIHSRSMKKNNESSVSQVEYTPAEYTPHKLAQAEARIRDNFTRLNPDHGNESEAPPITEGDFGRSSETESVPPPERGGEESTVISPTYTTTASSVCTVTPQAEAVPERRDEKEPSSIEKFGYPHNPHVAYPGGIPPPPFGFVPGPPGWMGAPPVSSSSQSRPELARHPYSYGPGNHHHPPHHPGGGPPVHPHSRPQTTRGGQTIAMKFDERLNQFKGQSRSSVNLYKFRRQENSDGRDGNGDKENTERDEPNGHGMIPPFKRGVTVDSAHLKRGGPPQRGLPPNPSAGHSSQGRPLDIASFGIDPPSKKRIATQEISHRMSRLKKLPNIHAHSDESNPRQAFGYGQASHHHPSQAQLHAQAHAQAQRRQWDQIRGDRRDKKGRSNIRRDRSQTTVRSDPSSSYRQARRVSPDDHKSNKFLPYASRSQGSGRHGRKNHSSKKRRNL